MFNAKGEIFQLYHGEKQVTFWWDDDDDARFVLNQHVELNFYNAISLKQVDMSLHLDTLFWFQANQSFVNSLVLRA